MNANQFDSKCSVHLDGGPGPNAPATAAGLPSGDYYFQVTDPSGKNLLSTDAVSNRKFTVAGGVIVAYAGFSGPVHPTGIDRDHSELGAITIRLANITCPTDFLDSPNNGGAYKVWATPVADFVGDPANVDNDCGGGCAHGFVPSKSKTDNFKARSGTATFCLSIEKQLLTDAGEVPGQNWQMDVTDPLGVTNSYFTDSTGHTKVCGLSAGAYTIQEALLGTYPAAIVVNGATLPGDSVYSFTWSAGKPDPVIIFRNAAPVMPE